MPRGERKKLSPPQLAVRYGVSPDKIRTWINNGELGAINVATKLGGRPRFRIDLDEVRSFEARRAVASHEGKLQEPLRRQDQQNEEIIKFF